MTTQPSRERFPCRCTFVQFLCVFFSYPISRGIAHATAAFSAPAARPVCLMSAGCQHPPSALCCAAGSEAHSPDDVSDPAHVATRPRTPRALLYRAAHRWRESLECSKEFALWGTWHNPLGARQQGAAQRIFARQHDGSALGPRRGGDAVSGRRDNAQSVFQGLRRQRHPRSGEGRDPKDRRDRSNQQGAACLPASCRLGCRLRPALHRWRIDPLPRPRP